MGTLLANLLTPNCQYLTAYFFSARLWNSMRPRQRLGVSTCLLNHPGFETQGTFLCERNPDNSFVEVAASWNVCSKTAFIRTILLLTGFSLPRPRVNFRKRGRNCLFRSRIDFVHLRPPHALAGYCI